MTHLTALLPTLALLCLPTYGQASGNVAKNQPASVTQSPGTRSLEGPAQDTLSLTQQSGTQPSVEPAASEDLMPQVQDLLAQAEKRLKKGYKTLSMTRRNVQEVKTAFGKPIRFERVSLSKTPNHWQLYIKRLSPGEHEFEVFYFLPDGTVLRNSLRNIRGLEFWANLQGTPEPVTLLPEELRYLKRLFNPVTQRAQYKTVPSFYQDTNKSSHQIYLKISKKPRGRISAKEDPNGKPLLEVVPN